MPMIFPVILIGLTVAAIVHRKRPVGMLTWVPAVLGWPAFALAFLMPIGERHASPYWGDAVVSLFFALVTLLAWLLTAAGFIACLVYVPKYENFSLKWGAAGLGLALALGVGNFYAVVLPGTMTDVFYAVDEAGKPVREYSVVIEVTDHPGWHFMEKRRRVVTRYPDLDGMVRLESRNRIDLKVTATQEGNPVVQSMEIAGTGGAWCTEGIGSKGRQLSPPTRFKDNLGRWQIVFSSPENWKPETRPGSE